jgi:hypothetical protein
VLAQRFVIALLLKDSLGIGADLAMQGSIAQGLLSQHLTDKRLLLAL